MPIDPDVTRGFRYTPPGDFSSVAVGKVAPRTLLIGSDSSNPQYNAVALNGTLDGNSNGFVGISADGTRVDKEMYLINDGPIQCYCGDFGGFVLSRMTTAARLALTNDQAPFGTVIYDLTLQQVFVQVNPAGPTWKQIQLI